ncbi:MAG: DNA-deoxyinosine glycosylase [Lachnospiraceae bacterium]|nr:DNA-deoxyinosine glycosylase [Lachnospiraceae bacterium]
MIVHPIPPVFDKDSRILILGSFPSVKSRESMFFYGHPQNRFWKVVANVFHDDVPVTIPEKKAFLLRNHIAVWDVIHSCDIEGSSDSSIKNVTPNDLSVILEKADIRAIFTNGKTSDKYYRKYIMPNMEINGKTVQPTNRANETSLSPTNTANEASLLPTSIANAICLPSTSPANAAWSMEKLIQAWSVIVVK